MTPNNPGMARSNTERLEFYLDWRDAIEDALVANAGNRLSMFTIRGRTASYADHLRELEFVKSEIGRLQALVDSEQNGAASNRVRLRK